MLSLALPGKPSVQRANYAFSIPCTVKWSPLHTQADFAIAVEAAVHLANARQRLLAALKRAEAGCRALPEEPPAAVQALAHVVNGVSA